MSGTASSAAIVLAVILTWAGTAKLRGRSATAASFADLGLPAPRALALAVPVVELIVAGALVLRPRAGAAAAIGLLLAFTVFLVSRNRAGASVGCGCFGSARSIPPSVVEIVRNAGLIVVAATAATTTRPALPTLPEAMTVLTAVAVAAVALALLDVYVTTGRLLDTRLPTGPGEGTP